MFNHPMGHEGGILHTGGSILGGIVHAEVQQSIINNEVAQQEALMAQPVQPLPDAILISELAQRGYKIFNSVNVQVG